jgi:hypothetical protein
LPSLVTARRGEGKLLVVLRKNPTVKAAPPGSYRWVCDEDDRRMTQKTHRGATMPREGMVVPAARRDDAGGDGAPSEVKGMADHEEGSGTLSRERDERMEEYRNEGQISC